LLKNYFDLFSSIYHQRISAIKRLLLSIYYLLES